MKQTFAALCLVLLLVGGCSARQPDAVASDFLGPDPVYVLTAPERVEGWNFVRADGSIASDPPIRVLDISIGRELGDILLSEGTYRMPAGGNGFERAVGFRLWRSGHTLDVILSFKNDQMLLKYTAGSGQPTSSFAGVTAAHGRLVGLAKKAFPEYTPPK